jgi:hypothetical protein
VEAGTLPPTPTIQENTTPSNNRSPHEKNPILQNNASFLLHKPARFCFFVKHIEAIPFDNAMQENEPPSPSL